jgi:hypothetical protein
MEVSQERLTSNLGLRSLRTQYFLKFFIFGALLLPEKIPQKIFINLIFFLKLKRGVLSGLKLSQDLK